MSRHRLWSLLALALLLALPAMPAVARYYNIPGSICRSVNGADARFIGYELGGVRSSSPAATDVICPLTRTEPFGLGALVFVDVSHVLAGRTSCTLFSIGFSGAILGTASGEFQGGGFREITIDLTPPGFSDNFSDYSVVCTIQGNNRTVLYGADLSELEPIAATATAPLSSPRELRLEARRAEQQRVQTLEREFAALPQIGASAAAESEIRERLAADDHLRDAVRALSCTADACRVELDAENPDARSGLVLFVHHLGSAISHARSSELTLPDGSRRLVLYLSR